MRQIQTLSLLNKGLTASDLILISKVISLYDYKFTTSYRDIGKQLNMTYENVRYHFKKLEKVGLISIEHSSTRKLVCHINRKKVNELL